MHQIIVINLDADRDRFARLSAELAAQGQTAVRLAALRGTSLPRSVFGAIRGAGAAQPGTLGCFLSHVRSWEMIAAGSGPGALVLEDDARLIRPLGPCLDLITASGADLVFVNDRMSPPPAGETPPAGSGETPPAGSGSAGAAPADTVPDPADGRTAQILPVAEAIVRRAGGRSTACGGDGYYLSRAGAERLVDLVARNGVWGDVDWLILFAAVGRSGLPALRANRIFHRKLGDVAARYDPEDPILQGRVLARPAVRHSGDSSPRKAENAEAARV